MTERTRNLSWWWTVLVVLSVLAWGWHAGRGWWMVLRGARTDVPLEETRWDRPDVWWEDETGTGEPAASVWLRGPAGYGRRVIVFRSSLGGLTSQQRAEAAVDRLRREKHAWTEPLSVEVRQTPDGLWAVFVNGVRIATADAETARSNNTTCEGLARVWADNIRSMSGGQSDSEAATVVDDS